jgi:thioredoxin-related protein
MNIKRLLCVMTLVVPLLSPAQSTKGIRWATGLSWGQVRQKARQENKYIFIDCYTTWCGPCKTMDNSVYINDTVGNFFNEHFISVKVQMDRTQKDNAEIQSWYEDAAAIGKEYHIEGYPTFIFFSPHGEVVEKQMGFKAAADFIALGKASLIPGKKYDDVYAKYSLIVAAYKNGHKDYDKYPFMIKMSDKTKDTAFSRRLIKELSEYVSGLPVKARYTKDRIEMWSEFTWASSSKVFNFFYNDWRQIDKVMDQKGYSASIVDKTIQSETVIPFLKEQAKGSGVSVEGMYITGQNLKSDADEADWDKLNKIIEGKYGSAVAKRNVVAARVEWYARHNNQLAASKYTLKQLNSYPPNMRAVKVLHKINAAAWGAFINSTDKKILKGYIQWLEKVVQQVPDAADWIDTYANLLYKCGQKKEAIHWEQIASGLAPTDAQIKETLQEMIHDRPTRLREGAVWDGINSVNWKGFVFEKVITVKDENGKPIGGVSVKNKTGISQVTGEKGTSITKVSLGDILTFSHNGYDTQEVSITKDPGLITIVLKPVK